MLAPLDIRPTVVLVDDDAALRMALKFSLEIEGFQVKTCASGEDLLASTLPSADACLVLDYNLTGINGIAALEELRRRNVRLPALLITSNPGRAVRQAAEHAKATIVEKPLLNDALFGEIRSALGQSAH